MDTLPPGAGREAAILPGSCRLLLILAAVLGGGGVVLAAAASHGGDPRLLANASMMCLAHAPVVVALVALAGRLRLALPAGALLGTGTVIFAGDLVLRALLGPSLFALAAPIGGVLMLCGWLVMAVGAAISFRPKRFH